MQIPGPPESYKERAGNSGWGGGCNPDGLVLTTINVIHARCSYCALSSLSVNTLIAEGSCGHDPHCTDESSKAQGG